MCWLGLCNLASILDTVYSLNCGVSCMIILAIDCANALCVYTWILVSIVRLGIATKRRHNYLYLKYRMRYLATSLLLLAGYGYSLAFNFLILYKGDAADGSSFDVLENAGTRILYFLSVTLPTLAVTFFLSSHDLFAEYNRWPEQLSRVSSMQYTRFNYQRFGANVGHRRTESEFNRELRNRPTVDSNDSMFRQANQ